MLFASITDRYQFIILCKRKTSQYRTHKNYLTRHNLSSWKMLIAKNRPFSNYHQLLSIKKFSWTHFPNPRTPITITYPKFIRKKVSAQNSPPNVHVFKWFPKLRLGRFNLLSSRNIIRCAKEEFEELPTPKLSLQLL